MKTVKFKLPSIEDVTFEIEAQEEDMSVKGNASAIDEETDKETEDYINAQLDNGNIWAWCVVKVTAKYKGHEGTDYLGGCSYESEKDFVKNSGYYEDMKQTAYDDLISQLESLND